jgi:hypothetical protein
MYLETAESITKSAGPVDLDKLERDWSPSAGEYFSAAVGHGI